AAAGRAKKEDNPAVARGGGSAGPRRPDAAATGGFDRPPTRSGSALHERAGGPGRAACDPIAWARDGDRYQVSGHGVALQELALRARPGLLHGDAQRPETHPFL